jgi:hypothetical protein
LPSEKHSDLDFRDLQAKCRRAIESGNDEKAHQEARKAAAYFIRLGKYR